MSSNLFPKNVFKGKNSDGSSFTVREYDFETYANLEFMNLLLMLFGGALIYGFISPIYFIFLILSFDGRFSLLPLVTIILSGFFIIDAKNGWIFTNLISIFFDNSQMSFIFNMHCGIISASVVLLAFSDSIHRTICKLTNEVPMRWILFLLIVSLGFSLGYLRGYQYTSKTPDWVDKNLKIGKYKVENETTETMVDSTNGSQESIDSYEDYSDTSSSNISNDSIQSTNIIDEKYQIGQKFEGGTIFQLNDDETHGLVFYDSKTPNDFKEANIWCSNNNYRLPSIDELINIVNNFEVSKEKSNYWSTEFASDDEKRIHPILCRTTKINGIDVSVEDFEFVKCYDRYEKTISLIQKNCDCMCNTIGVMSF